jgi:hypothetical protein
VKAARTAAAGERANLREQMARDQALADLRSVMDTPAGRRFMWGLLGECGLYRASFNNSGSITAFNEGQRDIGLRLVARITQDCPAQYLTMQGEAIEADRKATEQAQLDADLNQEDDNHG